jgi:membrane protease YdiL (CAAX protease family)
MHWPVVILFVLGGLGPAVSAIVLLYVKDDAAARRDYWRRVTDIGRIRAPWYAAVFLIQPAVSALAIATGWLLWQRLPSFAPLAEFVSRPLLIVPSLVYALVFGPLPEELGWRGYALDRLQEKWNPLVSSLVLGVLWVAWHLPMFFMAGTYQRAEVGLGTMRFWLGFGAANLALTVLMTWVYNNTRRSTLSAVLMHFMVNLTGELLDLPDRLEHVRAAWMIVAAIVVALIWGLGNRASRNRPSSTPTSTPRADRCDGN